MRVFATPMLQIAWALRRVALVAAFVSSLSCGGGGATDLAPTTPVGPSPVLTTVLVSLSVTSIRVGETATASASGLDQNGAAATLGAVTWSTGSFLVATVSASGAVTGVAPGTTQIIATAGSKQGQQIIQVVSATPSLVPLAGGTIYIGAEREPFPGGPSSYEIISVDPNTGVEKNLTLNAAADKSPLVSPDGQYIRFFTDRFVQHGEWAIMKRDGSVQRIYSGCQYNDGQGPITPHCVTPRGWLSDSRLLFLVTDISFTFQDVRFLSIRNPVSQAIQAFSTPAGFPLGASFSPTADIGVYNSGSALFSARVSDGRVTQIAPFCAFPATCGIFTWAPSGNAVFAARDGAIQLVAVDGSSSRTLYSATSGALGEMSASPDGSNLAFMEGTTLKVLRLSGAAQPSVQSLYTPCFGTLVWSTDSKSIAFGTNAGGSQYDFANQLSAMNLDGSGRRVVASMRLLGGATWGQ